uniref:Uncharacterized protein n=1 Tax=Zea mays TaxID=4577 RepID=A0A804QU28_MAIZE
MEGTIHESYVRPRHPRPAPRGPLPSATPSSPPPPAFLPPRPRCVAPHLSASSCRCKPALLPPQCRPALLWCVSTGVCRVASGAMVKPVPALPGPTCGKVPSEHVPVVVGAEGEDTQRFIVPVELLGRPPIVELLRRAAQEYRGHHDRWWRARGWTRRQLGLP